MGDPRWYYKVLGLHCDGTNGSTTFTDVKGKTVTVVGNAQISTAQYPALTGKTSSAYFGGSGDYLYVPDSANWDFGTGDFTVRLRVRFSSVSGNPVLITNYLNSTTGWTIKYVTASSTLGFYFAGDTGYAASWSPSLNTWYDIEVSRSGTSLRLFIDGTQLGTTQTNSTNITGSTTPLYICSIVSSGHVNGYISEVEVYNGAALHTANFTPSTVPFADEYVSLSGTVKDESDNPVSRLVRVYRRDNGVLAGETVSHPTTGAWKVPAPNSGTTTPYKFHAVCHSSTGYPGIAQYMVLGISFQGADGSTSITDATGKTVTNSNVTISTAQYPSITGATSSGLFNSTSDYLSVPKSTAFKFSGDFTVRARLYLTAYPANQATVFATTKATASDYYSLCIGVSATKKMRIRLSTDGTSMINVADPSDFPLNTWKDVEFVRYGSTVDLRIDGTLVATGTVSGEIYYSTYNDVYVATDPAYGNVASFDNKWQGYMRDLIVLNGFAMHTSDFIVPTTSFLTNLPVATENATIFDDLTPA